jgi:hypothetical protein
MRKVSLFLLLSALPLFAATAPTVSVLPAQPLIEKGRGTQIVNFDLLIENPNDIKLEVTTIEMSLIASDGSFIAQRRVQPNGMSILTIPNRFVEPKGRLVIFNPFHTLPDDLQFSKLRFEIVFGDNKETDDLVRAKLDVTPKPYVQKTVLELPIRGRVFVHDGHEFLSHHRRLDITGDMTTAMKIDTNMGRYAYDFVNVDEQGRMRKGESQENSDYYVFGAPLYAPGDGVVLKSANETPDNDTKYHWKPDFAAVLKNIHMIGGNYVVLDHGNGEYSFIAHMKFGSVTVKAGDRVKRGQKIGEVGASGDAIFPHVHYQFQKDDYVGEGLPSYFVDFERVTGGKPVAVTRGQVDTGDVLLVKKR